LSYFSADFLAVNPIGTVPVLITDDDGPMTGIKAIRKYLATRPGLADHDIFKGKSVLTLTGIFPIAGFVRTAGYRYVSVRYFGGILSSWNTTMSIPYLSNVQFENFPVKLFS
jgi:hypothetical protein